MPQTRGNRDRRQGAAAAGNTCRVPGVPIQEPLSSPARGLGDPAKAALLNGTSCTYPLPPPPPPPGSGRYVSFAHPTCVAGAQFVQLNPHWPGIDTMANSTCPDGSGPIRVTCTNESHRRKPSEVAGAVLLHWHAFGQRTTLHGISHFYQTQDGRKRYIWFWLTVLGFIMTTVHLYFHTVNFLSSPVATVIKHQAEEFKFPDVTFCSLTPTSQTFYFRVPKPIMHRKGLTREDGIFLGTEMKWEEVIRRGRNASEDVPLHRNTFYHQRTTASTFERSYYPYSEMIMECRYRGESCKPDDFILLDDPYYWNCYTFRPKERKVLSTMPKDGLNVIVYTGTTTIQEFTKKDDTDAEKKENSKVVNKDTLEYKLKVHGEGAGADFYARILLPEQEPTGLKIAIHEPLTHPHPRSQGFVIGNGVYAKIGIEMIFEKKLNRKGVPCNSTTEYINYRNALNYNNTVSTNLYKLSNEACLSEKAQEEVISKCNCTTHYLPLHHPEPAEYCYNFTKFLNDLYKMGGYTEENLPPWRNGSNSEDLTNRPSGYSYVDFVNFGQKLISKSKETRKVRNAFYQRRQCHDDVIRKSTSKSKMANERICEQNQPCNSAKYSYFYSTAPYPRDYGLAEMIEEVILPNVRDKETGQFKTIAKGIFDISPDGNWSTREELVRNNFVKIVIHPLSMKSDAHEEEFTYNIWEALSELGGITGLWVGMSFLTVFEFFDLILDILTTLKSQNPLQGVPEKDSRFRQYAAMTGSTRPGADFLTDDLNCQDANYSSVIPSGGGGYNPTNFNHMLFEDINSSAESPQTQQYQETPSHHTRLHYLAQPERFDDEPHHTDEETTLENTESAIVHNSVDNSQQRPMLKKSDYPLQTN